LLLLTATALLGGVAMAWLGYWVAVRAGVDDGEAASFPPWFLDPDDPSWQLSLTPNEHTSLGRKASRPVRVCGVHGEQAYLASVRCAAADAHPVTAPFDSPFAAAEAPRESEATALGLHYVDRVEVPCPAGKVPLYLSPYHCDGEPTGEVPAGFVPRFGR
jgi:hypothetical protein